MEKHWLNWAIVWWLLYLIPAGAFTIDMDFESGAPGSKVEGRCTPGQARFTRAADGTFYTVSDAFGFGQSAELNIEAGSRGTGSWGGIISFEACGGRSLEKGDEVWIRLRTKFPADFDFTADPHLLFLRLPIQNEAGNTQGASDIYIPTGKNGHVFEYVRQGDRQWVYFGNISDRIVLGLWETYEWYVKLSDIAWDDEPGEGAVMRFWKNDNLLVEITDKPTLAAPGGYLPEFHLFTYWHGGSPRTQKMYIDDLKITTDVPDAGTVDQPRIGVGSTVPKPPLILPY
ncbi:MAG TPA: hypothetical protein VF268_02670 [Gammaproteobacteria bacterium]|jgi:hypothetical protein